MVESLRRGRNKGENEEKDNESREDNSVIRNKKGEFTLGVERKGKGNE